MSNNLKMFGRYGLAIAITYATAKGWIKPGAGDVITDFVMEAGALLAAFGPALYAAMKVDNTPT